MRERILRYKQQYKDGKKMNTLVKGPLTVETRTVILDTNTSNKAYNKKTTLVTSILRVIILM